MILNDVVEDRLVSGLKSKLSELMLWFEDPLVEDICVNADGRVFAFRRGATKLRGPRLREERIQGIINAVAGLNGQTVNESNPRVEAVLPFSNARFHGVIQPECRGGSVFTIRIPPKTVYALHEWADAGVSTPSQLGVLMEAIWQRDNILIVGSTGAGKTTLLNSCLHYLVDRDPEVRIVTIEDTPELRCEAEDWVSLITSHKVSMQGCLKDALRLRPDRIVVGEVRDGTALDLLKAWNTGHPGGLSTVHADSAELGLIRLEDLAREATSAPQHKQIAAAINVVAFIRRDPLIPAGRRLTELVRVSGHRSRGYVTEAL
jgi:P-type conjugative transfer ATPase TrbB